MAGEARARLEAAQGEFDMALHHLSRLPVRIDLDIPEVLALITIQRLAVNDMHAGQCMADGLGKTGGGDDLCG